MKFVYLIEVHEDQNVNSTNQHEHQISLFHYPADVDSRLFQLSNIQSFDRIEIK
jgi:hypothetical protein